MHRAAILLLMLMASTYTTAANTTREPLSSSVEMVNGRPIIFLNGEPQYPMIHSLTDVPSGRWSWEELPQHNIENFGRHGVRLFQLDLFLEHVWPDEDSFDITLARKQIAGVLEVCPDAAVFFRFHLRAPTWWLHQHPEEWVVYADTDYIEEQKYGLLRIIEHDNNPVRRVSMASRKWREAVTGQFIRFLKELAATPEGNALAGIQVANGVYGEWHNWGFYSNEPDVSLPMSRAFQDWTREKYGSESALQSAWQDPHITFADVTAPGMDLRATSGTFRDPQTQRQVIDYYTCMHEVVADNIIHFTKVLKANWPRPIIAGTFYGYYFSTFDRQAAGGHLQLQRILAADSIDYLSGPQAYGPESIKVGDPYRSRSLIATVRLHNKLWLDEMDVEPKIPLLKSGGYAKRVQESVADVRRNAAFSYTKGMGLWFYDFNISGVDLDGYTHATSGSQGNWDHPVVMRQIQKMHALFRERSLNRPYQSGADVLFVYDTDSLYYTGSLANSDPVSSNLIDFNTLAAFRSGVVFDPVHVDDLSRIDLSPYKVVVFGNTFLLSQEERQFIREHVAAGGRHLVWFYAPGFIDESTGHCDPEFVEELTGFHLETIHLAEPPAVRFMEASGQDVVYPASTSLVEPLFAIDDADARYIAEFTEGHHPAIAQKVFADHTAWFVSLPGKGVEPIQYILRHSGAHLYGEGDGIFYSGGGILVLHTLTGGPRHIQLPNGTSVKLPLPPGPATVLIDSQSGEVLMNEYPPESEALTVQYPQFP